MRRFEPVVTLQHNQEPVMLISTGTCREPKRHHRQVLRIGEFSDSDIVATASAEPPTEAAAHDDEVEGTTGSSAGL